MARNCRKLIFKFWLHFPKKWILKFLIFEVRVKGSYFCVAHERTLVFHLGFISGAKNRKYSILKILIKKLEF